MAGDYGRAVGGVVVMVVVVVDSKSSAAAAPPLPGSHLTLQRASERAGKPVA